MEFSDDEQYDFEWVVHPGVCLLFAFVRLFFLSYIGVAPFSSHFFSFSPVFGTPHHDPSFSSRYSRAQRTKPQSGRHAEKQWRERQEKRKAQFDERREGDQKSCDDSVEEGRSRQDSTRSRNDSERDRSDSAVEPVAGAATTTEPNQASEEAEGDSALANVSRRRCGRLLF